jgi:hypothetical protein
MEGKGKEKTNKCHRHTRRCALLNLTLQALENDKEKKNSMNKNNE